MKNRKRVVKTACVFLLVLIFALNTSYAQGLTTPCNGGDPDVDCPIDGGVFILAVLVCVYVLIRRYRIRQVKKAISKPETCE